MVHLVIAAASLLTLLAACGGDASAEDGERERPKPRVEVAAVETGVITVQRTYLGQVRSLARATLAAGSHGAVREVSVREGDRVERGDVLVIIDERLARAQLQAAQAAAAATEAQHSQAERDAERYERAGERTVAGIEIERAVSQAAQLSASERNQKALAARARAQLARHRVEAPFAGVIAQRLVDPGDWVTEGTPVLELVAHDALEVNVRAEPDLLGHVEPGHPVTLVRGTQTVPATVRAVVPALDPATRTIQLRVMPDESPPWLLAGDALDVRIEIERDGEGVVVPRDALVPGAVETRVVEIEDGKARPVAVEVVDRGLERVRVRGEGLEPGDRVAVRGNERLRPDQPVQVVE